jgi:sugar lactone lactonase YvrE
VDGHGNLYVSDLGNHRVLEYDHPLTTAMPANRVFGQPDFAHATQNTGGLSAASLDGPVAMAVDALDNLYVADAGNNRVLEYTAPLTSSLAASRVLGQPGFTANTANNGGLSAASLSGPEGVAVDAQGTVYVADLANNRVLQFSAPLSNGQAASRVYGQPDFGSSSVNNGGVSSRSLQYPSGVALDAQGHLFGVDYSNNRVLGGYRQLTQQLWLPLVRR